MGSSPPEAEILALLDRVQRAESLVDALCLVVEGVLAPLRVERAVAAEVRRGALRGVAGIGWGPEEVRAFSVPLTAEFHPAVRAVLSGEPTESAGEEMLPGLERAVVLPLPGTRGAAGALVLDPGRRRLRDFDPLGGVLRALGPAVGRLAELEELRRSAVGAERQRELLSAVVNALPDPVLITDAANNVLLENGRAEVLLTSGEGDSEGRRRAVEINNLLLSSFLTRSVVAGSDPRARELNLVDPTEGGDLLFEVLATPLPAETAGEGVVVSVLRDVTDLKRAATELEQQFKRMRQAEVKARRERDRLNLILENVGDPILVTDEDSNVILTNHQAERLFESVPGTPLDARRHREVRTNDTKFSSFISDFALSSDTARIEQLMLTDPDTHEEFPAEVVSGKILNERSEMTAIVSIVHDLTKVVENERLALALTRLNEGLEDRVAAATAELEERNRQLQWQSRELERAYQLKSEFLASMSHELRTPINALLGYTSLMRDRIYGEITQRQEEALDRMYAASQHLLELVNDVLDLAKIEAGKMPVHLERVDIAKVIQELAATVEPMVRQKELQYRQELAPELPILETDRTKVKQILLNLLSNAVKFTHRGEIRVTARRAPDGDGVEVEVADSGIGIPPEHVENIFEDFRQVDQSSTREYGGTGLGLSITQKLLKLLGGTIRLESRMGEGSTFTVRLPLRGRELRVDDDAPAAASADGAVVRAGEGERR
ncbi:MAG TPA: ATP-binding protein [Longimicrobiaceae bacterium]|nr:ATP-binding protein [Longimicrobiaceae bacterium]